MTYKNLVLELTKKIAEKELISAHTTDKQIVVGGSCSRITGKITKSVKIKKSEYDQLVGLYKFIQEHKDLTQEELDFVLKTKFLKFRFLRKVNALVPDFLNELKMHGAMQVALYYANRIQVNEQIDGVLK